MELAVLQSSVRKHFVGHLADSGMRPTKQRELVYALLLGSKEHPTADKMYAWAKAHMESISLATIYNCLELLVACNLVKQVQVYREPARYCANRTMHGHFHCRSSGKVVDVELPPALIEQMRAAMPEGCELEDVEITFHGSCEDCEEHS